MATLVIQYPGIDNETGQVVNTNQLVDTESGSVIGSSPLFGSIRPGFNSGVSWPHKSREFYDLSADLAVPFYLPDSFSGVWGAYGYDIDFTFAVGRQNSDNNERFTFMNIRDGSILAKVDAVSLSDGSFPYTTGGTGSAGAGSWGLLGANSGGYNPTVYYCFYNYLTGEEIEAQDSNGTALFLRGSYEGIAISFPFAGYDTIKLERVDLNAATVSPLYEDSNGTVNVYGTTFLENTGEFVFYRGGLLTFLDVSTGSVTRTVSLGDTPDEVRLTASDGENFWLSKTYYSSDYFSVNKVSANGSIEQVADSYSLGAAWASVNLTLSPSLSVDPTPTSPFWTDFHLAREIIE